MEEFTRVDIFDTKGVEYIFVIGYLVFLIVFWNLIKNPGRMMQQIRHAASTLSASLLKIPQGVFFSRNHAWTHLGESGVAKVGMDDFLQHVTGKVNFISLKNPGEVINRGDLLTEIEQDGKRLSLFSPISGEITSSNLMLEESPEIINKDPYGKGWIYKVKPKDWVKETNSCLLGDEATEWSEKEMTRFKDFLTGGPMRKFSSEPSMALLQDGGEIRENILSELPDEVWHEFQEKFLNSD